MNTDLLNLSNEALGAALRVMLTALLATPERPTAEMAVTAEEAPVENDDDLRRRIVSATIPLRLWESEIEAARRLERDGAVCLARLGHMSYAAVTAEALSQFLHIRGCPEPHAPLVILYAHGLLEDARRLARIYGVEIDNASDKAHRAALAGMLTSHGWSQQNIEHLFHAFRDVREDGSDTAAPLLGRESTPPREAMRPPPMPGERERAKAILSKAEEDTSAALARLRGAVDKLPRPTAPKKGKRAKPVAKTRTKSSAPKRSTTGAKKLAQPVKRAPALDAQQRHFLLLEHIERAGSDGASARELAVTTGLPVSDVVATCDALATVRRGQVATVHFAGTPEAPAYGTTIQAARKAARRAGTGRAVA